MVREAVKGNARQTQKKNNQYSIRTLDDLLLIDVGVLLEMGGQSCTKCVVVFLSWEWKEERRGGKRKFFL